MSPSNISQPSSPLPAISRQVNTPGSLLPSPHLGADKEPQELMLENIRNHYFTWMSMNLRTPGHRPLATPHMNPRRLQAGLNTREHGRQRGYPDSPTFSDSTSSSTGSLFSLDHTLQAEMLSEHPAGPAGNPRLNNTALQGIWDIYRKEAGDFDAAMIESWNASIDNLVVFAGLFSSIITALIVESYKSLRPPRPSLLHPSGEECAMFGCGPHTTRINTMWFTSLALSLASALVAMIAKQWIAGYKVELLFSGTGSSEWFHEACRLRQFRYEGLRKYKMAQVISATPILLHTSLWCFCIGIIDFLWTLNHTVAIPFTCLCGLTFAFYVGSTISAVVSPRSPFKTALARLICGLRGGCHEEDFVQAQGAKLDEDVIEWLISTSRNQNIYNEAMKALLELRKVNVTATKAV